MGGGRRIMIEPKYVIYHDLIGFKVYAKPIHKKNNDRFKDIGIIIDDTKNILITEKNEKRKKYIKKDYIFRIDLPKDENKTYEYMLEVKGTKIIGRPENRLRNLRKKRWFN
jgi:RNase P/RNase MRP subunit p29